MVQTLSRESNLVNMPKLDFVVIDEAHHVIANSYESILERCYELNPNLMLLGVTATPVRGDKSLILKVFKNVCHVIKLQTLIDLGYLVPPRTFAIDIGLQEEIDNLKNSHGEYDLDKVGELMDCKVINEKIVQEWIDRTKDRKTVVFCSTVSHAYSITRTFTDVGIKAEVISGDMPRAERQDILQRMTDGKVEVIVNVAVLTEGWDYPPISCVMLLRPCSFKGTMIQMIGRRLRTIDATIYPNVIKQDCIVLDFGASLLTHQSLEQDIKQAKEKNIKDAKTLYKTCPECYEENPIAVKNCIECDFEFKGEEEEKTELVDIEMIELNLLKKSVFNWFDINKTLKIASGFYSGAIVKKDKEKSIAIGIQDKELMLIGKGSYIQCLAIASDFMNKYETDESCKKSNDWQNLEPTDKQKEYLTDRYLNRPLTRYEAGCVLKVKFNFYKIKKICEQENISFGFKYKY